MATQFGEAARRPALGRRLPAYSSAPLWPPAAERFPARRRRDRSECTFPRRPSTARPSFTFIRHKAIRKMTRPSARRSNRHWRQSTVARCVACATDLCRFWASPAACDATKSSASIFARDQTENGRGWIDFFPDMGWLVIPAGQNRMALGRGWPQFDRRRGLWSPGELRSAWPASPTAPFSARHRKRQSVAERLNDQRPGAR